MIIPSLAVMTIIFWNILKYANCENEGFEFCTTKAYGFPFPITMDYCLCEGGKIAHPIKYIIPDLLLVLIPGMLIFLFVRYIVNLGE